MSISNQQSAHVDVSVDAKNWSSEFISRAEDKSMVEAIDLIGVHTSAVEALIEDKFNFYDNLQMKTADAYKRAIHNAAKGILSQHPLQELTAFPFDIPEATINAMTYQLSVSTLADVYQFPAEHFEVIRGVGPAKAKQLAKAISDYATVLSSKAHIDLKKSTEDQTVFYLLRHLYLNRFYGQFPQNLPTTENMMHFIRTLEQTNLDLEGFTSFGSIFFPRNEDRTNTRTVLAGLLNEWVALNPADVVADEEDIKAGREHHMQVSAQTVYDDFLNTPSTYYAILSRFAPEMVQPQKSSALAGQAFAGGAIGEQLWESIKATELDLSLMKNTLRPYQEFAVKFAVHQKRMLLGDDMGLGKALPNSEPVLTPAGFKPMGELRKHDFVVGRDGKPTKIVGVFPQGEREIYRVTFQDGSFVNCDLDHLWTVQTNNDFNRGKVWRTLTARELLKQGVKQANGTGAGNRKFRIPMMDAVEFPHAELPIDPYILGALLGDGGMAHSATPRFSTADSHFLDEFALREPTWVCKHIGNYDYSYSNASQQMRAAGINHTNSYTKSVPEVYKTASVAQRLEVVQGLMDTDGWISQDGSVCQFTTVSPKLAEDFMWFIRSLGGVAKKTIKPIPKGGNYEVINVTVNLPSPMNPFKLERKASKWASRVKYTPTRLIDSIEFSHVEDATCIKVAAADELFVTRDFVVTHNTISSIAVMSHVTAQTEEHITHLVVAPKSVQENWSRELKLHSQLTSIMVEDKRQKINPADYDVIITTYERINTSLASLVSGAVIVDEAHLVKNPEAQRTQRVLSALEGKEHAMFLTGTAIENNLEELTNLVSFVAPGLMSELAKLSDAPTPDAYRDVISTAYLRRNKEDVLTELPELTIKDEWVQMGSAEESFYADALGSDWHAVRKAGYRQVGFSKITRMREIVENAQKTGEKVLIFSFYLEILDTVAAAFPNLPQVRVDGSVDASERQKLVDEFGAVNGTSLFISQISTGGVGLNLQSASRVILCEPQIKFSLETQAIARAHRMGQLNPVIAHRLATVDTLDERIVGLRNVKENLFDEYARNTDLGDKSVDLEDEGKVKKQLLADERAKHGVSTTATKTVAASAPAVPTAPANDDDEFTF